MGKAVLVPVLVTYKKCLRCNEVKPAADFGVDKRATDRLKSECKQCRNAIEKQRRENWSDEKKSKHNQRTRQYLIDNKIKGKAIHLYNAAQTRSKKKGWDITLSRAFIHVSLILGVCQRSGLPFRYEMEKDVWRNPMSASLDRKDNSKGYTDENVQIVCNMYNAGKGETDDLTFIAFCMAVAEKNKDNEAAAQRLKEMKSL